MSLADDEKLTQARLRRLQGTVPTTFTIEKIGSQYYAESCVAGGSDWDDDDADEVIQYGIDNTTNGVVLLKNATYTLGTGYITHKPGRILAGESWTGTILDYSGTDIAIEGTDLDFAQILNLKIQLAAGSKGGILIGEGTTFSFLDHVYVKGATKATAGQYGLRYDGGDTWGYYNTASNCKFDTLNLGIITDTSGAQAANGQMILNPILFEIGSIGIDFSPDQSGEHTVLGGWWASSENATGFKADGIRCIFVGGQLEMGTGSSSFLLDTNSSRCMVFVNSNCPSGYTDSGTNNFLLLNADLVKVANRKGGAAANVSDNDTIAHGLSSTPTFATVTTSIANEFASVTSMDATYITVAIKKHDGSAGTQQTIYWYAEN